MNNEIEAIERKNTWDLVDLPVDKNVTSVKWVYKIKLDEKGDIEKLPNERLVSIGFSHNLTLIMVKKFAPVARLDTCCFVLAISTQNKWPIYQMDVRSAFLNGVLNEGSVRESSTWIWSQRTRASSVQIEENIVWFEASFVILV